MNYTGNLLNFQKYIINKKSLLFNNNKELLNCFKNYDKIHKTILNKFFYKIKLSDYNIENISNIENSIGPYYLPQTKNKKGTFYLNLNKKWNMYELFVLSLHELIPGHHYESTIQQNNKSNYIKYNNFSIFSEGWGLYCENICDFNNDYIKFFQLYFKLHRILRCIVEIGINVYKWNEKKAKDYLKKYIYMEDELIHEEILRYIDIPGQNISYFMGYLEIIKSKDKFLKKNNNIKEFHKNILKIHKPFHLRN